MTKENLNFSVNDLERVKFTEESDTDNSVVQTYETNNELHNDLMCLLNDINKNLEKMNFYWEMITNTKI